MGVQGLWSILYSTGRDIDLSSLEGKVLAIDMSIWLNQALKSGIDSPNMHLEILFRRICKLLFYKIKPVFVFDGPSPQLKRETIILRRNLRQAKQEKYEKIRCHIVNLLMKKNVARKRKHPEKDIDDSSVDMFKLPANEYFEHFMNNSDLDQGFSDIADDYLTNLPSKTEINFESESFKAMPLEVQHEVIRNVAKEKRYGYDTTQESFATKSGEDFSALQIQRLLSRNSLQEKVEILRATMNYRNNESVIGSLKCHQMNNLPVHNVNTKKVLSRNKGYLMMIDPSENNLVDSLTKLKRDLIFQKPSEKEKLQATSFLQQKTVELGPLVFEKNANERNLISEQLISERTSGQVVKGGLEFITEPTESQIANAGEQILVGEYVINEQATSEGTTADENILSAKSIVNEQVTSERTIADEKVLREESIVNEQVASEGTIVDKQFILGGAVVPEHAMREEFIITEEINEAHNLSENLVSDKMSFIPNSLMSKYHINDMEGDHADNSTLTTENDYVHRVEEDSQARRSESSERLEEICMHNDGRQSTEMAYDKVDHGCGILSEKEEFQESDASDDDFVDVPEIEPEEQNPISSQEFSQDDIDMIISDPLKWQQNIEEEISKLYQEEHKLESQAASMSERYYVEAKELLKLFGIPYVESPAEAEAQCAFLEKAKFTDGTITEDSDIWLFGGRLVYKHVFSRDWSVRVYNHQFIYKQLGLTQDLMICIALLSGSDYTPGVYGIGPVIAMEILADFSDPDIDQSHFEVLQTFKEWHNKWYSSPTAYSGNPDRKRYLRFRLDNNFPDRRVMDAYSRPLVDESTEPFIWSKPSIDKLLEFAQTKMGWEHLKVLEMLNLVIDKNQSTSKMNQKSILDYFTDSRVDELMNSKKSPSKRLKLATKQRNFIVENINKFNK